MKSCVVFLFVPLSLSGVVAPPHPEILLPNSRNVPPDPLEIVPPGRMIVINDTDHRVTLFADTKTYKLREHSLSRVTRAFWYCAIGLPGKQRRRCVPSIATLDEESLVRTIKVSQLLRQARR